MYRKNVFIFYGSLSVVQVLEDKGINTLVKPGMTKEAALAVAGKVIGEYFKENGGGWDYDLDLDVATFEGDKEESFLQAASELIDNFEKTHDFEEEDGSGNAQGFTAVIVDCDIPAGKSGGTEDKKSFPCILIFGEYDCKKAFDATEDESHTVEQWQEILEKMNCYTEVHRFDSEAERKAFVLGVERADNYFSGDFYTVIALTERIIDSN